MYSASLVSLSSRFANGFRPPLQRTVFLLMVLIFFLLENGWATEEIELCKSFRKQGKPREAIPYCQKALSDAEKDKSDAVISVRLDDLAGAYQEAGQYENALPFFERALAIDEKVYGSDHLTTGTSLNNLAILYFSLKRYEEALPLMARALKIRESILGVDHPDTQSSKTDLTAIRSKLPNAETADLPLRKVPSSTPMPAVESPLRSSEVTPATLKSVADCARLSNGQMVRVRVIGQPLSQSALVLEASNGQVTVRVMGQSTSAGRKLQLPCTGVR